MRKLLLLVALLVSANAIFSQTNGLSKNDFTEVIQKCIDLPQLQQYYTVEGNGYKQMSVCYFHPILFPIDIVLQKGNKNLEFKEIKTSLNNIPDDFFLFKKVEEGNNSLTVTFQFYYDYAVAQKVINATISLQKVNETWTIVSSQLSN